MTRSRPLIVVHRVAGDQVISAVTAKLCGGVPLRDSAYILA
jgi:hypothetical protein